MRTSDQQREELSDILNGKRPKMDEDNTVATVAYPKNISNCEVVPFMPSGPSIGKYSRTSYIGMDQKKNGGQ